MKSAIIETIINKPFEQVLTAIRNNIVSNGFLLLHEINTQEILANHGIKINQLRQLLYFHPSYMTDVLKSDPLAVNEVPLKIVIREIENCKISISFPNPTINFSDYDCDKEIGLELLGKIKSILKFTMTD